MRLACALGVSILAVQGVAVSKGVSYYCPNTVSAAPAGWAVPVSAGVGSHHQTITYVTHADGQSESLDLYMPPGVTNPPVLVIVHGGGFTSGTRQGVVSYLIPFVAQGYAVANVSYRLAGLFDTTNNGLNPAPAGMMVNVSTANLFPAGLQDVRCAIRTLSANAVSLGINPGAIGAYGVSAGGNLVAMLGTTLDYDPTIYGTTGAGPQTLDSVDCPVGSPSDPSPMQSVFAPAAVQLVIDESGNDTIGQGNNTFDNSAWGAVLYSGDVADAQHLFNLDFKLTKGQVVSCTAPNFPTAHGGPHCATSAGLAGNLIYQGGPYPLAYPDTQFANNVGNPAFAPPAFFILNGAIDPIVGPQSSADLFDVMTGANASGTPVLVEATMQNGADPDGVLWSAPAVSANAAPVTYFLMPNEGHIPALLAPALLQRSLNDNGSGPDLQAASCAVLNTLYQVLQLPGAAAASAAHGVKRAY